MKTAEETKPTEVEDFEVSGMYSYNKQPKPHREDLFSLVPITQHIMSGFQLKKKKKKSHGVLNGRKITVWKDKMSIRDILSYGTDSGML